MPNIEQHDHDQIQALLPFYVNGQASIQQRHEIDQHIRQCAQCRQRLSAWQRVATAIRTEVNERIRGDSLPNLHFPITFKRGKTLTLTSVLASSANESRGRRASAFTLIAALLTVIFLGGAIFYAANLEYGSGKLGFSWLARAATATETPTPIPTPTLPPIPQIKYVEKTIIGKPTVADVSWSKDGSRMEFATAWGMISYGVDSGKDTVFSGGRPIDVMAVSADRSLRVSASNQYPNEIALYRNLDAPRPPPAQTYVIRWGEREARSQPISIPLDVLMIRGKAKVQTTALALSPDGRYLAIGDTYGLIDLWDTTIFDPATWANANSDSSYFGTVIKPIATFNVPADQGNDLLNPIFASDPELSSPIFGIYGLSFSPDGRYLAASGALDGSIYLWNEPSGRWTDFSNKATIKPGLATDPRKYISPLQLSFSPDSKLLATAGRDEGGKALAFVYDIAASKGTPLRTSQNLVENADHANPNIEYAATIPVQFSPDGKHLALIVQSTLVIWSWETEFKHNSTYRITELNSGPIPPLPTDSTILIRHNAVAFNPDGGMLLTVSNGMLERWTIDQRGSLTDPDMFVEYNAPLLDVQWSGGILTLSASLSSNGRLDLMRGSTLLFIGWVRGVVSVALSPDSTKAITAMADGSLKMLNIGNNLGEFEMQEWVTLAPLPPIAPRLAFSGDSHHIAYWRAKAPDAVIVASADDPAAKPQYIYPETRTVLSLAVHPNTPVVAISAPAEGLLSNSISAGEVTLWNWETDEKTVISDSRVTKLLFSSDGKSLAMLLSGGSVIVQSLDSANPMLIKAPAGVATAMAFSPNGSLLAVGYRSGNVFILDSASGQILSQLSFGTRIGGIAFGSQESTDMAIALDDGTVRVWHQQM